MSKVLYIDDEADTEKMASKFEIMKEEGIEIVPVSRVRDVLPTLDSLRGSIDLIVLDLIMPPEDVYGLDETEGGTLTGLRLLEDIRRHASEIPVIIVSVRRSPYPERISAQYGISHYLEKPISASALSQVIRSLISST